MAFVDMGDQFIALAKGAAHVADQERHIGLVVDDLDETVGGCAPPESRSSGRTISAIRGESLPARGLSRDPVHEDAPRPRRYGHRRAEVGARGRSSAPRASPTSPGRTVELFQEGHSVQDAVTTLALASTQPKQEVAEQELRRVHRGHRRARDGRVRDGGRGGCRRISERRLRVHGRAAGSVFDIGPFTWNVKVKADGSVKGEFDYTQVRDDVSPTVSGSLTCRHPGRSRLGRRDRGELVGEPRRSGHVVPGARPRRGGSNAEPDMSTTIGAAAAPAGQQATTTPPVRLPLLVSEGESTGPQQPTHAGPAGALPGPSPAE